MARTNHPEPTGLPEPPCPSRGSLEAALSARRSVREFAPGPLDLGVVARFLWAAQGVTGADGVRTAPSAGALYPLEVHLVAGTVTDVSTGAHHYRPAAHDLTLVAEGDLRPELAIAALDQQWLADAPAVIVLAAVPSRITRKYGRRGDRYVYMEVGHAAQNIHLQAAALGLGTCVVGAFDDDRVAGLLQLPAEQLPMCLMPIGTPHA